MRACLVLKLISAAVPGVRFPIIPCTNNPNLFTSQTHIQHTCLRHQYKMKSRLPFEHSNIAHQSFAVYSQYSELLHLAAPLHVQD